MKRWIAGLALGALAWGAAAPAASATTIGITGPGIGVTNTPITFDVTYAAELVSASDFALGNGSVLVQFGDGAQEFHLIGAANLTGSLQVTHTFLANSVYTLLVSYSFASSISGEHLAFGQMDIEIADAVTPIPPTLALFVSALAGLGYVGWRRRNA